MVASKANSEEGKEEAKRGAKEDGGGTWRGGTPQKGAQDIG